MFRERPDNQKNKMQRNELDFKSYLHCIVTCYDSNRETVHVVPVTREPNYHGENPREPNYEDMQELKFIPVSQIMGVKFIPEVGSAGKLLFHDTDIDNYVDSSDISDPNSPRTHDYSDAVFIPSEVASEKPEAYVEVGCDYIKINKDVESEKDFHIKGNLLVDGDIGATGDVTAMNGAYSLSNLALQYISHTHVETGAVTVVTTNLAVQGLPVIMTPKICPSEGCE